MPLTAAQARVLQAIRELTLDGWPTTYREICRWAGIASLNSAFKVVAELKELGLVETRGQRGIRLMRGAPECDGSTPPG